MLLSGVELGATWLAGIATFAQPLRGVLIVAAVVCLIGGGVSLWRQCAAGCVPGAVCARPPMRALTVVGLLAGATLLYFEYVYV